MMRPIPLTFSRVDLRTMLAVLDAPTNSFVALVRVAGLEPTQDFRGADLRGVDFGTDDLAGFDFSGADLTNADLSRATGLDRMITDSTTRLPPEICRPQPDFDLSEVMASILDGFAPRADWIPFITKLDFSRTRLSDLRPLSGLASLQSLDLSHTSVIDLSPLSGLTSLQDLDLDRTLVTELSPISGLNSLLVLNVSHTRVSDISPLSALTSLVSLGLWGTPINDISPLSTLIQLIRLDLDGTRVWRFARPASTERANRAIPRGGPRHLNRARGGSAPACGRTRNFAEPGCR
jgi:hypothetical protein